jgi:hypothetical protein
VVLSGSNHLKLTAPIIIIGNGRSGSTLLNNLLGSHPDIVMLGEMYFGPAQAWNALWTADANNTQRNISDEYRNDPELESRVANCPVEHQKLIARLQSSEYRRTAEILRRAIAEWFCLPKTGTRYWGFKGIFNGSIFHYEWKIYDQLFPDAIWLHIVRHPLHFAGSAIASQRREPTPEFLKVALQDWLNVFRMSRQRSDTGRYWEIKYETLVADPSKTLRPVLEFLDVGWDDASQQAMSQQWGTRSHAQRLPPQLRAVVKEVPDLEKTMFELGYQIEDERHDYSPPVPRVQVRPNGRWQLVGPFWRELGNCWIFSISDTELHETLSAYADQNGDPQTSLVRLFENDHLLGPPHCMHASIREIGRGAYSHWQGVLMFSTSDNSNPNQNGRTYTIDCGTRSLAPLGGRRKNREE